ncbi:serine/threonine protein kinase [Rubripirellula amarantea]|nr:serine/threonine protein kinase [Rubripirellula amarantea]
MNIKSPKAGNYRPKCKHCGKYFRLQVTDDNPPKFGVGKIVADKTVEQSALPPAKKVSASDMTSDGTVDPVASPSSRSKTVSEIEATIDGTARRTKSGTNVTMGLATNAADRTIAESRIASKSGPTVSAGLDARQSVSLPREADRRHPITQDVVAGNMNSSNDQIAARTENDLPERVGGYRILRLLGRGAMGAVYEAKQISLDRLVALKTVRGRLADNPAALARFTREAYAAAQLNHHNVVQIYDFGEDDGRRYFSMEWVRGVPLDQLVKQKGSLDPRLAAGYILQAARGLAIAHKNGMVHRDIKPANLLLSDEGVVKVADLGLVKIPDLPDPDTSLGAMASGYSSADSLDPSYARTGHGQSGTQVTMHGTAVGTPAYMAPEQSLDAASVDHRADIYSLGCTLFYLLAGQVPFGGSVVSEVMQQHVSSKLPNLMDLNARIPPALNAIVQHAMAKRPDQRYSSLEEMCDELEDYLGVSDDGKFSPTSSQADELESIAKQYISATKLQGLDGVFMIGLIGLSCLLMLFAFAISWRWGLMGPALFASSIVTVLVLAGRHSQVNQHVRRWVGTLRVLDYVTATLGMIAMLVVVIAVGCGGGALAGVVLGVILGAGYHFTIALPTSKAGDASAEDARKFIRDLRISGADETGIRTFVARYSGKSWQRFFERLFGYSSLVAMRKQLAMDPSFTGDTSSSSLRDRVCSSLAKRVQEFQRTNDHARLARVEQLNLASEGLNQSDAKERAWQMAAAVMEASKISAAASGKDAKTLANAKREKMKAMLADARSGNYKVERDKLATVRALLSGQTRLLVGSLLLSVFAFWGNTHGLFDSLTDIETLKQIGSGNVDITAVRDAAWSATAESAATSGAEGAGIAGTNAWSVGIAGLLLVLSAFVSGWRMTPFAVVATLIILFGPVIGIPGVGSHVYPWMLSALIGLVVYLPGVLFGESKAYC